MIPQFLVGRERELRDLIIRDNSNALDEAACSGLDTELYFPDDGPPDAAALARCDECPCRVACLALALRVEEPDERHGWYAGLSPRDRDDLVRDLGLAREECRDSYADASDRAVEARRLHRAGWPINDIAGELGCCRRTVQRWLRTAA